MHLNFDETKRCDDVNCCEEVNLPIRASQELVELEPPSPLQQKWQQQHLVEHWLLRQQQQLEAEKLVHRPF